MSKISNKDLLNSIHNESSAEYKDKVSLVTDGTGSEVLAILENYPTIKNEFINTLTNKVGKTMFFSKVFANPLKALHRGLLPYGKTIEEIFVQLAEKKGWGLDSHFTGSTSIEGDLIRPLPPKAQVDYITQNYAYKFKTSISDSLLRGAFTSQNGLSDMISQAVNSLSSSVYYEEYLDMKKILVNAIPDAEDGSTIGLGIVNQIVLDSTMTNSIVSFTDTKDLAVKIKAMANTLVFPSDKYNLAHVKTWSSKDDLILFITPTLSAQLDVETLAFAFNIDKAEVPVRTIIIDDLGASAQAVLADRDLIQAWDTINETNTFYNPEQMTTNYFAHKHGIMSGCKFANAVIFQAETPVEQ